MLAAMFAKYHERKIVCTKADIVAYGMGGLIARRFCTVYAPENAPKDGNYYSELSYKQGMVRRIITIATPHRGTTWANYLRGDFTKLNYDGEPGIVAGLKFVFLTSGWFGRAAFLTVSTLTDLIFRPEALLSGHSYSAIEDMSVGSKITSGPFPLNVPMHSIYGKTKVQL